MPNEDCPTLTYVIRIPSGMGSLAFDESVGAAATTGYFTAAFVGLSPNYIRRTQGTLGDPENRIMVFRMPIVVQNRSVTRDNIEVIYRGRHVLGPAKILGDQGRPRSGRQRGRGGGRRGGRRGRGRLLAEGARGEMVEDDAADADHRVGVARMLSEDDVLQPEPCLDIELLLFTYEQVMFDSTFPLASLKPWIEIKATFRLTVLGELNLRGQFCIDKRRVTVSLVPSVTPTLLIAAFGEVISVLRAGIEMNAEIFGIDVVPSLAVWLKGGIEVGGRIQIVLRNIKACITVWVDSLFPKFCCVFGVCAVPCGLEWKRWYQYNLACFGGGALATWTPFNNIDRPDTTPPIVGNLTLTQLSNNGTVSAEFPGFLEEESEIITLEVYITNEIAPDRAGLIYFTEEIDEGTNWQGDIGLNESRGFVPPHGQPVAVCIYAENSALLSSYGCSCAQSSYTPLNLEGASNPQKRELATTVG